MKTTELAEFLATEQGLTAVRALQSLGVFGVAERRASSVSDAILEWKPVRNGDELAFERADFFRCKPKRIAAKHETLRICLFGESMAAGFPLAPAFTPAIALEEMLRTSTDRSIEVIDLSMPNMGPSEQLRVCEAARLLEPDVCVFMTGNNWYYGLSVEPTASQEARVHYASHVEEGGPRRLAAVFRQQLEARAHAMVETMVRAAHDVGAKAIVVVPAANHDWERLNPPPWLGEGKTAAWFDALESARRALANGDAALALEEAKTMEKLEGTLSGTPQRIMARALLSLGRAREARDAAMSAIDASNWHNYSWALPQAPSYVADVMRNRASELDYQCIDLERVFADHTGSPFLDFRMFYDHCHLSVEGIQAAMSAVAAKVLGSEPSSAQPPAPNPLIAASASFQAAHWTSQFYPSFDERDVSERLRTQLSAAVALDDHFVSVLRDQLRLKSAACSPGLHAALPAAARVPGVAAALTSKRLNAPFIAAILELLGDRAHDVLDELLATHEEQLRRGLDVAQTMFRTWFWERTPLAWNDPCERQSSPFHRASWRESRFDFLSKGEADLAFELVARSPAEKGTVVVRVNDQEISSHELSARWTRCRGTLVRAALRRGVNQISLSWSKPSFDDERAIATAQKRLALGVDADLFPVFGEVYSLTVRAGA